MSDEKYPTNQEVIEFIRKKGNADAFDIEEEFQINLNECAKIMKQLEKENLIRLE